MKQAEINMERQTEKLIYLKLHRHEQMYKQTEKWIDVQIHRQE